MSLMCARKMFIWKVNLMIYDWKVELILFPFVKILGMVVYVWIVGAVPARIDWLWVNPAIIWVTIGRDHSWQKSVAARDLAPTRSLYLWPKCCCGNRKENEKPKVVSPPALLLCRPDPAALPAWIVIEFEMVWKILFSRIMPSYSRRRL